MSKAYPPSVSWGVSDPTRTLVLRRKFSAQMTKRFGVIKGRVNTYMADSAKFEGSGLKMAAAEYDNIPLIIDAFMRELSAWERETILDALAFPAAVTGLGWTTVFTNAAYDRGIRTASANLSSFLEDVLGTETAAEILGPGFFRERMRIFGGLTFSSLEGITSAMNDQILRIITEGLIQGKTRKDIARLINSRVDKIGITRARRLARTSIAHIYNEGAVDAYKGHASMLGREILGEYITAGDSRVRPRHAARAGKFYELDVIRTLFGEPNCRCTFAPVVMEIGQKMPSKRFGPVNPLRQAA